VSDENAGEEFVEPEFQVFEVGLGGKHRDIQLFEGFGDAFGLREGKASRFGALDRAAIG
jgi:hypothetical protein